MAEKKPIGRFLFTLLIIWMLGGLGYIVVYLVQINGSYSRDPPSWVQACSRDAQSRAYDCNFEAQIRQTALSVQKMIVTADMNRQIYMWHHIASVIIFFVVVATFVLAVYLAYLEFSHGKSLTTENASSLINAKFFGMEFSSSLIGLSILIMAFAFFMAYLVWVYPITSAGLK